MNRTGDFASSLLNNPPGASGLNVAGTTPTTAQPTDWAHVGAVLEQRHAAGVDAVRNSSDVQSAIKGIVTSAAVKAVAEKYGVPELAIANELRSDVMDAAEAFYKIHHGEELVGSVELINFTASFLQDKISSELRIPFPPAALTNLAGAVAGAYLTGFVMG